jgi:hypothetical protein
MKNLFNNLVKIGNNNPDLRDDISPILHHIRESHKTGSFTKTSRFSQKTIKERGTVSSDELLNTLPSNLIEDRKGSARDYLLHVKREEGRVEGGLSPEDVAYADGGNHELQIKEVSDSKSLFVFYENGSLWVWGKNGVLTDDDIEKVLPDHTRGMRGRDMWEHFKELFYNSSTRPEQRADLKKLANAYGV